MQQFQDTSYRKGKMQAKRKKPVHENLNCFLDAQPFPQVVMNLSPVGS